MTVEEYFKYSKESIFIDITFQDYLSAEDEDPICEVSGVENIPWYLLDYEIVESFEYDGEVFSGIDYYVKKLPTGIMKPAMLVYVKED